MLHVVLMVKALGGIFCIEVPTYKNIQMISLKKHYILWNNMPSCFIPGTTFYGPQHNVTALTQHQLNYHFVQTGSQSTLRGSSVLTACYVDSNGNGYFKTVTSTIAMTYNIRTAANSLHAINNDQTLTL